LLGFVAPTVFRAGHDTPECEAWDPNQTRVTCRLQITAARLALHDRWIAGILAASQVDRDDAAAVWQMNAHSEQAVHDDIEEIGHRVLLHYSGAAFRYDRVAHADEEHDVPRGDALEQPNPAQLHDVLVI